jgi:hypothetical protein
MVPRCAPEAEKRNALPRAEWPSANIHQPANDNIASMRREPFINRIELTPWLTT